MTTTKVCPSCGANNDIIFTNCLFCKTGLPSINIDEITNDDLIMKASEWVEKSAERVLVIKDANANEWTMKGIKTLQHGEILANAEKYLNLLSVRAISNETIKIVYQNLKTKLEKNKKSPKQKMVIFAIAAVILFIFIFYMALNERSGRKEVFEKLERIEFQIQDAIKDKNYDYALVLVEQLVYSENLTAEANQKIAKQYDEKRKALKETILKLKELN